MSETNDLTAFHPEEHLLPKVNKADFYRLTDFDFGWMMRQAISNANPRLSMTELASRLSPGQKAMYYGWNLDGEVKNGGFEQFYANNYGEYIPAILVGFRHIGAKKAATLVSKADKSFQKTAYKSLSEFDKPYYDLADKLWDRLVAYAKKHPSEFCRDENGDELDPEFTGTYTVKDEKGNLKAEFSMKDGAPDGAFTTFFENGKIESRQFYEAGKLLDVEEKFGENGELVERITHFPKKKIKRVETYFPNGNLEKVVHLDNRGMHTGGREYYYENGQLELSDDDDMGRLRKEFWENGNPRFEADYVNGKIRFLNAWDEKGNQTMKDGTGHYFWINIHDSGFFGIQRYRMEGEMVNFLRHGKSRMFANEGYLMVESEYQNGKLHGKSTSYNADGSIKSITHYENGEEVE